MKRKLISILIAIITLMHCIPAMAYSETEAINMLEFSYLSFEKQTGITLDVSLPDSFKGHNVVWESTNPEVISNTGKVIRPAVGEPPVTLELIAKIGSKTRTFEVTVLPFENSAEVIALAKSNLKFNKISTENRNNVTTALVLPATDEYGTIIRWESSDSAFLKIVPDGDGFKGEISRAAYSDGNILVFLTATLLYGDANAQTKFYITISEHDVSYIYSSNIVSFIEAFNNEFIMNNNTHAVRDDLILPEIKGATVTYTSSDPDIISNDGKVRRPTEGDKTVYFTATLENGYENTHFTYSLIVKAIDEDEAELRLEEDLQWAVAQISSVTLGAVTEDLKLPTKAPNGSKISYTSSNTAVLGSDGKVKQPAVDTDVFLNVRVYFAETSKEQTLTICVKAKMPSGEVVVVPNGNSSPASPSAGGTAVPVPNVTPAPVKYTYSDVTPSHWAYNSIEDLTKRGIIDGNDDGTFMPSNSITREAFIKMLVTAMELSVNWYETPFTDASESAWYYNYVATAANLGLVNGLENDFFGVGHNITRQDICVLIHRAFYAEETAADANCNDYAQISDYAKTAVSVMYKNGILQGDDDGNFNPKTSATRAEVATIFSRVLGK